MHHPEQDDRWTWLVILAYTQLRLARAVVADQRLAWERHLPPSQLTHARVRRAFPSLLLRLGTPADARKPWRLLTEPPQMAPLRPRPLLSGRS